MLSTMHQLSQDNLPAETMAYWPQIWELTVLPRVKTFFSRLGHDALPVMSTLRRRIQRISPQCQVCGLEDETIRHLLFDCPFAKAVWLVSPLQIRSAELPLDTKVVWLWLWSSLQPADKPLSCYIAWEIWKARNKYIFEGTQPQPLQITHQAIHTAKTKLHDISITPIAHRTNVGTAPEPHMCPNPNPDRQRRTTCAYAIVDASVDHRGRAGVGMVLYNEEQQLQLVYFAPSEAVTAFQAEAEAVGLALRDWNSPFLQKPVHIYTDCQRLVKFLEIGDLGDIPCWQGAPEAQSCWQKLVEERIRERGLRVYYIPRNRTWLAHELANVARRTGTSFIGLPMVHNLMEWGVSLDRWGAKNFLPP
jgi:ribonuclease HI